MNGAPRIVMYSTDWCGYCTRARQLLESKGVDITEIDVDAIDGARAEMTNRTGRTSVPQIFIGEQHIGGYDDTKALDDQGRLDELLRQTYNG